MLNKIATRYDEDDVSFFKEIVHEEIDSNVNIIVSRNGALCLDVLKNEVPDIIFLDNNMPIMTGRECFDSIKNNGAYKNIPIVMLSTLFHPDDIEYYKSKGANHLIKSMIVSQFTESIKKLLPISDI